MWKILKSIPVLLQQGCLSELLPDVRDIKVEVKEGPSWKLALYKKLPLDIQKNPPLFWALILLFLAKRERERNQDPLCFTCFTNSIHLTLLLLDPLPYNYMVLISAAIYWVLLSFPCYEDKSGAKRELLALFQTLLLVSPVPVNLKNIIKKKKGGGLLSF